MDFKKLFHKIFLLFSVQILGLTMMSIGGLGLNSNAQASPITAMSSGDCYVCGWSGCTEQEGDQQGREDCSSGMGICSPHGEFCGGDGSC